MNPPKARHRRKVVPGTQPGTLDIHPDAAHPRIRVFAYGPDELVEQEVGSPAELKTFQGTQPTLWVNVDGLGDEATLRQIADTFAFHRLAMEDTVSLHHRPKAEIFDNGVFIVARMPSTAGSEQVSFFLGLGYLVTFQETEGDCFEGVRDRLRKGATVIRRSGADYLAYALLDAMIDAYFPVVEEAQDQLEVLEEGVLDGTRKDAVTEIHAIKRRLQEQRRVIGPHRELVNVLLRDASDFVQPETTTYLRDCYDHILRLTERVDLYRERCSDLMSTYLSLVSNRMNEVMKVLTIFATLFMPLGFIAGLYGMNFNPEASGWNMPELDFVFGYPMALGGMLLTALGLLFYFKRKGWL